MLVRKRIGHLGFSLFFLCLMLPLFSADVSLIDYINEKNLAYSFDPFREIGTLENGSTAIGFSIDMPFLVVDYIYGIPAAPLYRDDQGDIQIPEDTVQVLDSLISRGASSQRFNISTIIIDPGHGGKDPGTIGTHIIGGERLQLKEKDLVLYVSRLLYSNLKNKYPGKEIFLTRDTDIYLDLEERTEVANASSLDLDKMDAVIFVSIHANASLNPSASGFEVWYLPPDYRRDVLDPESLDDDQRDIAPILNTIVEEEFTVESVILARNILTALETAIGDVSINRGLKEESWFVVRNAKMPSILIEMGFVTNKDEALLLADDEYLIRLSNGIYNGLVQYIDSFDTTNGFTE